MDWKQLGETLAKLGLPILGTALGGPAGGAIGGALGKFLGEYIGTPDENYKTDPLRIFNSIIDSPDVKKAAMEFELKEKQMLLENCLAMAKEDTAQMQAVNATLQADAKGSSWLQRNHHALESLWTLALLTAIYFVLPLCKVPTPSVPESAWITIGAMLGIRAWNSGSKKK